MATDRTHFVYEAYDADGLCLYIGCTGDPAGRYRTHMAGNSDSRGWFEHFVTHWRVSGPYPKPTALRIERERITAAQPIWNGSSFQNSGGKRKLIAAYLAHHGVRFGEKPWWGKPPLLPARRRQLRVVKSA